MGPAGTASTVLATDLLGKVDSSILILSTGLVSLREPGSVVV